MRPRFAVSSRPAKLNERSMSALVGGIVSKATLVCLSIVVTCCFCSFVVVMCFVFVFFCSCCFVVLYECVGHTWQALGAKERTSRRNLANEKANTRKHNKNNKNPANEPCNCGTLRQTHKKLLNITKKIQKSQKL